MSNGKTKQDLEDRIRTLEEQARLTLDILEMASTLGDFQTSINKLHEPVEILRETLGRIRRLVTFTTSAFYLVNEETSDFELTLCEPSRLADVVRAEVDQLIETGVFALALRENRPITVYSSTNAHRILLHALATSSRTRGMFVGLMPRHERNISSVFLALLSIVLKNCANAIESFELYRLYREGHRAPES